MSCVKFIGVHDHEYWYSAVEALADDITFCQSALQVSAGDVAVIDLIALSDDILNCDLPAGVEWVGITDLEHMRISVQAYARGIMDYIFLPSTPEIISHHLSRALNRAAGHKGDAPEQDHADELWQRIVSGRIPADRSAIQQAALRMDMGAVVNRTIMPCLLSISRWPRCDDLKRHDALCYIHYVISEYLLHNQRAGAVLTRNDDNLLIMFYCENPDVRDSFLARLSQTLLAIYQALSCDICAYLGEPVSPYELFHMCMALESIGRMYAFPGPVIVRTNDLCSLEQYTRPRIMSTWKILLSRGEYDRFLQNVQEYLEGLRKQALISTQWLSHFQHDACQLIYDHMAEKHIHVNALQLDEHVLQSLNRASQGIQECMDGITALLNSVRRCFITEAETNNLVDQAVRYLQQSRFWGATRDEVAKALYISPGYLSRIFKKQMGVSISAYISAQRLEYSKDLLSQSDLSTNEIAATVGYAGAAQFCSAFKRAYGITPQNYRKFCGAAPDEKNS